MTILIKNPRERTRFFRFVIVGIIGACVDFGVMNILVNLFDISLVVAGTISFITAIISNFLWNRFWTYPDSRSKSLLQQLLMFSIVSIIGLIIRVPILAVVDPLMERLLHLIFSETDSVLRELLSNNITLAIAVVIVMFWNFFTNRYWTYNDVE